MKLSIGTVQFGMDYGVQKAGQPSCATAIDMLKTSVQSGVTAIDCAAAYGTAEAVVGEFLSIYPDMRENVEITSKLSPDVFKNALPDEYYAIMRENLLRSLKKLGVNYLDNYLLHNSAHVFDKAIISTLNRLKQDGLVGAVGASVYTADEAMKGIDHDLDVLQVPYSVFNQRMDEKGVLELASKSGVKIHARSVFTQGLMLMEEADIPPHLEKAKPIVKKYTEFCKAHDVSRVQLAVAFIGRRESISHLVFGVDTKEQLLEITSAHEKTVASGTLEKAAQQFAQLDENIIMPGNWKVT